VTGTGGVTTGATKYGTPMPVDAGGTGGAVALYMAVMPDAGKDDAGPKDTGGAVALYMAQMPDAGPVLRYMAVMPPEAGVAQPDYMAVMPVDAARPDGPGGIVALYAAPVPTKN
jgi:hypothetical protein